MKQVEVTILGQGYILGCPDGGEPLLHAAVAKVDGEMSAIRDAGKVKARERIAVLAALNLAYQLAERPPSPETPSPRTLADAVAADQPDIEALIRRIDGVLGDEGLLL